ncbi:MAG: enoyl-CoA hydratase/isomerase family protein [Micropepsaceae bacterium]
MTHIRHETAGDTLVLTLDRPPLNLIDRDAVDAITAAARAAAADAPKGGVVLTGAGRAFSAGVDTRAFAGYDAQQRGEFIHAITAMTAALLAIPVPLIAAVNGHALGGGFILMLTADYRIVTSDDTVRLGLPEAQAGVPFPAGPAAIMRAELPPGLLRRLALTSRPAAADDLRAAGVIDDIAAPDGLTAAAAAAAAALAAQPAFAAVKRQVRGALADEVASLAAAPGDPFLAAFL